MTPRRPTASQLRALEAIERGQVDRYGDAWIVPIGVRRASVASCVQAGWVHVGPHVALGAPSRAPVVLTDAGREVLDAHS